MNWLKLFFASQAFHSFYHAVLAGASGFVVANGMNPSKAWITGLVTAVLGAIVGWLNGSPSGTNPAVQTNTPQASGQKIGMFLAFFLVAGFASAGSTVFTYGGGLNISKQTLTGPTPGLYSFPVIGLTGSAISYDFTNNQFVLAPEVGLSGAIVFGDCIATPDPSTGGIILDPQGWLIGIDAGGGAFQSSQGSNVYVGKGFIGPCVFDPKAFGNLGLAINQTLGEKFNPTLWALFVQSFDVGGGVPVTKLH